MCLHRVSQKLLYCLSFASLTSLLRCCFSIIAFFFFFFYQIWVKSPSISLSQFHHNCLHVGPSNVGFLVSSGWLDDAFLLCELASQYVPLSLTCLNFLWGFALGSFLGSCRLKTTEKVSLFFDARFPHAFMELSLVTPAASRLCCPCHPVAHRSRGGGGWGGGGGAGGEGGTDDIEVKKTSQIAFPAHIPVGWCHVDLTNWIVL